MFENYKNKKRLEAFRQDGRVWFKNYNKQDHTITWVTENNYKAMLTFDIKKMSDGNFYLIFSGDSITRDRKAMECVVLTMWCQELPEEFSANEELRRQVRKVPSNSNPLCFGSLYNYLAIMNEVVGTAKY